MMEFPFIGGTESGDTAIDPQRTINLIPEVGQTGAGASLIGFYGDSKYATIGVGPARAAQTFQDHMIYISGSVVHKITKGGGVAVIGNMGTSSGDVEIAENGLQLVIVDGQDGWIWDGYIFSQITDSIFIQLNSDSVTYLDSAFWVNRPGTGQFYGSNVLDASTWTATKLASAEYKSDNITKIWTDRELMIGGDTTVQVYYNSGASPMPMEPLRQGRMIYGIAAKKSVQLVDNTTHALFKDKNGGVFVGKLNGYNMQRISTRALERYWYEIDYEDSYSMALHLGGHELYIITFPLADTGKGRTFGYEAETKLWFELGNYEPSISNFGKYHAKTHTFFDGKNIIGSDNGDLFFLDKDSYTYNGKPNIAQRTCAVINNDRDRLFFEKIEFDMEVGKGLNSGQGSNPLMRLEISDDGGITYDAFREISIGKQGEYKYRPQEHQLGSSCDRVFRVTISDPVPRKFFGAFVS